MTLTRVWTPSGNYSSGSSKDLLVVHTMEGFTGPNGAYDCAKYFQSDCGASSQVCIDNNRGKIWECVNRAYGSWTQCQFNSIAVSCEQSGYASWSRQYWLDNRENQLRNIADWIAEESKKLSIPIVALSASQATSGGRGICYHSHLGSAGCGHSDPGGGWPLDVVLEWAKGGGGGTVSPAEGGDVVSSAVDPDGNMHYACVGADDGALYYFPPGWANWGRIDPSQGGAKSGAGITVDENWIVTITYTNGSGNPCKYYKKFRVGDWVWSGVGSIKAR